MTAEQKKDIIQWDIDSWSVALDYWEDNIDWTQVKDCLELGGRQGGLSLWLALKGKRVVCSDLKNASELAEPLHKKYNVTSLIEYKDIDASDLPYENHFDLIVFKSIIGGIGSNNNYKLQEKVFSEIHKALKPGGKLLFAENLVASEFHQWFRRRFVKWGSTWRYITIDELKVFLGDYKQVEIKSNGFLATFGRSEYQRSKLALFDKFILSPLMPQSWKYIAYGIATK